MDCHSNQQLVVIIATLLITARIALAPAFVQPPPAPVFRVTEAAIRTYNMYSNSHLNATFDFCIRAYRAPKIGIDYLFVGISIWGNDQPHANRTLLASPSNAVNEFTRPPYGKTLLRANLFAQNVKLDPKMMDDFCRAKKDEETLYLDVKVESRVEYMRSGMRTARRFGTSMFLAKQARFS